MNWTLEGFKTYIAAIGVFGLGLYQFSQGDYAAAWNSFMTALGAVGIRHAISRL